jgi:hypothetical protein
VAKHYVRRGGCGSRGGFGYPPSERQVRELASMVVSFAGPDRRSDRQSSSPCLNQQSAKVPALLAATAATLRNDLPFTVEGVHVVQPAIEAA